MHIFISFMILVILVFRKFSLQSVTWKRLRITGLRELRSTLKSEFGLCFFVYFDNLCVTKASEVISSVFQVSSLM